MGVWTNIGEGVGCHSFLVVLLGGLFVTSVSFSVVGFLRISPNLGLRADGCGLFL